MRCMKNRLKFHLKTLSKVFLLYVLFFTCSCEDNKMKVNNVNDILNGTAIAVPLSDNKFLVSGSVDKNFYLFGKGYIKLSDFKNKEKNITVLTKKQHQIGENLVITILKSELLLINDNSVNLYIEE